MPNSTKKLSQPANRNTTQLNATAELTAKDVAKARIYIAKYWEKLTQYQPKDEGTLIGLPNPYLVPAIESSQGFDLNEMYYWDSYFIVQGLLNAKHEKLVLGILDNLIYLQKTYSMIPNASRTYFTSRSQPPFLTTLIFDIYDTYNMGDVWLNDTIGIAKQEYATVWVGKHKPHLRQVFDGLSRYYDVNMLHDLAEAESGWDMNTRFNRQALDYIPIDLNCLLYKYESDFAKTAKIIGDKTTEKHWLDIAKKRANNINKYLWSPTKNFYFDYNYQTKKLGTVESLAGFYPLWAGLVDSGRAHILVNKLRDFEHDGGLATTTRISMSKSQINMPMQWAYPNGWAPLHYIIISGLEKYGYHLDAKRIAMKWLKTNNEWFNRQGKFIEKYNVVDAGKPPQNGLYPTQVGFGWTNAIFEKLCKEYVDV